jgi:NAD(P)-dependent dehydrogenase (short-subunit alcohol dehydrogenase family)
LDTDEAEWNTVMHTNLRGAWLMSKAVGKRMRAAKRGGSFINISSITGLERSLLPGAVAYGTSKAGLNYLTKVWCCSLCMNSINMSCRACYLLSCIDLYMVSHILSITPA